MPRKTKEQAFREIDELTAGIKEVVSGMLIQTELSRLQELKPQLIMTVNLSLAHFVRDFINCFINVGTFHFPEWPRNGDTRIPNPGMIGITKPLSPAYLRKKISRGIASASNPAWFYTDQAFAWPKKSRHLVSRPNKSKWPIPTKSLLEALEEKQSWSLKLFGGGVVDNGSFRITYDDKIQGTQGRKISKNGESVKYQFNVHGKGGRFVSPKSIKSFRVEFKFFPKLDTVDTPEKILFPTNSASDSYGQSKLLGWTGFGGGQRYRPVMNSLIKWYAYYQVPKVVRRFYERNS